MTYIYIISFAAAAFCRRRQQARRHHDTGLPRRVVVLKRGRNCCINFLGHDAALILPGFMRRAEMGQAKSGDRHAAGAFPAGLPRRRMMTAPPRVMRQLTCGVRAMLVSCFSPH